MDVYINKKRGTQVSPGVLYRPYIELIIKGPQQEKLSSSILKSLGMMYTVIIRDYKNKVIFDNLDQLKNVPLNKSGTLPKCIINPFKVKLFKPHGQYGIGISFLYDKDNTFTLKEDLSFYDTKDLRDLESDDKEKTSVLMFVNEKKHSVDNIVMSLEKLFRKKF